MQLCFQISQRGGGGALKIELKFFCGFPKQFFSIPAYRKPMHAAGPRYSDKSKPAGAQICVFRNFKLFIINPHFMRKRFFIKKRQNRSDKQQVASEFKIHLRKKDDFLI